MKLYYARGACSLTIRIMLHELSIKAEYEAVDLKTKKTETGADFYQINPKGSVPTLLLDDNQILTENAVILQYLADKHNAAQLLPSIGDFNRYRVLEWVNFITTELHKGFSPLHNPTFPQEIKENLIIPTLKKKFEYADHQLANHTYLAGNEFTLPDIYMFVILLWAHFKKIDISEYKNLTNYFNELKNRKSIHEALIEEGLNK